MSAEPTVREWLETALTPLLPSTWRIIPNQSGIQTIDQVVVVFKQTEIEPLTQAPSGTLSNKVIITIIDPNSDPKTAENALDDTVLELVSALDSLPGLNWSGAKKVIVNDTYLGWDITTTIISKKKVSTP